jgi:hypothetical protein
MYSKPEHPLTHSDLSMSHAVTATTARLSVCSSLASRGWPAPSACVIVSIIIRLLGQISEQCFSIDVIQNIHQLRFECAVKLPMNGFLPQQIDYFGVVLKTRRMNC